MHISVCVCLCVFVLGNIKLKTMICKYCDEYVCGGRGVCCLGCVISFYCTYENIFNLIGLYSLCVCDVFISSHDIQVNELISLSNLIIYTYVLVCVCVRVRVSVS